jgi:excisionase family DNA binding protein
MEPSMNPATITGSPAPIAADKRESKAVLELRDFMALTPASGTQHASLQSPDGERLEIPTSVYKVLVAAVAAMAQGNAVSVVQVHHELTTQQAAELLNVSRPHLIKLLEAGEIPFRKTGTHRRVYFEDLLRYRQIRDLERRKALRKLTQKSAEYGLEY